MYMGVQKWKKKVKIGEMKFRIEKVSGKKHKEYNCQIRKASERLGRLQVPANIRSRHHQRLNKK